MESLCLEIDTKACCTRSDRVVAAMDVHPWIVLCGLSLFYFAIVLVQSALKLMWLDELISLYIAKLGSSRAIWSALEQAADPNPPLYHWLSMWTMRVVGQNAFGLRLPAILAGWASMAGVYLFLWRRVPVIFATIGTCSFMAMGGFDYAYEGRPYTLLLCFSIMSLLLWRSTVESDRGTLPAIGLALVLAAGISSNYFGGLAVFPIVIGECVRTFRQRRVLWRVCLALFAGTASIFAYLPLIHSAMTRFVPHAWNKAYMSNVPSAYFEMVDCVLAPALLLLATMVAAQTAHWWSSHVPQSRNIAARPVPEAGTLPLHETAAIVTLGFYPLLGYGIASMASGMISAKCVVPVCLAFAVLIAIATFRLCANRGRLSICLLAFVLVWISTRQCVLGVWLVQQRRAFFALRDQLPALSDSEKVLVPDCFLVLPLYYYGSQDLKGRIEFPIDFAAIHRYKGEDSGEQNLWAGRNRIFPVPVRQFTSLKEGDYPYLIVAPRANWFLNELRDYGHSPKLLRFAPQGNQMGDFTPLSRPNPAYFTIHLSNIMTGRAPR